MASNMLTVSEDLNSAEAGTTSPTATSPVRPDIRRSLSPILDFGSRRNFCNISECSYCRPLAENHRPSPLRSPVAPPTASTKLISLHFSSCDAFVIFVCLLSAGFLRLPFRLSLSAVAAIDRSTGHDDGQHRQPPQQRVLHSHRLHKEKERGTSR